ncbi:hypothetical protein [Embleya sp. NPDC005575]|uniref:hypothetical protein n=1 Tax=Embleya sp. NPDC005575 TaxID=3156892 RepID=UPI0033B2068D
MGGTALASDGPGAQTKDIKAEASGANSGSADEQSAKKEGGAPNCSRPADDCSTKPAHKPTDKPTDKPVHKPAEKPMDKPADKPSEKPMDKPSEKPMDKPSDKPMDKPVHKPADKPMPKPVHKPDDRPMVIIGDVTNNHIVHNTTINHTTNVVNNHKTVVVDHKPAKKPEAAKHTDHKHKQVTPNRHHEAHPVAAPHTTQTKTVPVGSVAGGAGGTTGVDDNLLGLGAALAVAGAGVGAFVLRRGSLRG